MVLGRNQSTTRKSADTYGRLDGVVGLFLKFFFWGGGGRILVVTDSAYFLATCAATGALAGSFPFLITTVRHLTCATFTGTDGVDGICGDISGFQKSFGLCLRGYFRSISLPIYLYILRDGAQISTIEI